jgi:hypothetical protein
LSYAQRRTFLWALFLAGLVLIAVVANATTLVRVPFQQMARQAVAVGRMRCLSSESQWENGDLWTVTRFEVTERDKGLLAGIVSVRMMGGSSGSLHSHVDGVPVFQPGEEVYLFLWGTPGGEYSVLGWSQGTFRIRRDARAGTEYVTQDSAEMPVFDAQRHAFVHGGIRKLPVAAFQQKLKRALEAKQD